MPQVTNRKLVGEMAATPSGQGTVYSAMLKSCSTNRERAARVNDSERQKLQKATMVIDKHNRHNQWRCEQEIERVRQSLKKLDAFKKVLREDYPAKNLIIKTSLQKTANINVRSNAPTEIKLCADSHSIKDGRESVSIASSNPRGDNSVTYANKTNHDDYHYMNPASRVSINLKEQNKTRADDFNKLNQFDVKTDGNNRRLHDAIDIVTSANTTKHTPVTKAPAQINLKNNPPLSLYKKTQIPVGRDDLNNADDDDLDKSHLSSSNHKSLDHHEPTTIIPNQRLNFISKPKPINDNTMSVESSQNTDNTRQTLAKTNDSEDSDDPGITPEMTPDQQKKLERLERLRAKWKTMMEDRVCNRGFDMATLSADIGRKLKRMEVGRQHREFKKWLLEKSMADNKRIIRTSKAKFDALVMKTEP